MEISSAVIDTGESVVIIKHLGILNLVKSVIINRFFGFDLFVIGINGELLSTFEFGLNFCFELLESLLFLLVILEILDESIENMLFLDQFMQVNFLLHVFRLVKSLFN